MKKIRTLHRQITIAFVKLAVASCIFFGILASITVEGIEYFLVDERLASVAAWASPRHAAGMPVDVPAGLAYYHGNEMPQFLRDLPEGVHEFFIDNNELHVLSGKDAAGRYVVVDHASEYDKIELVVYSLIGVGCLAFIIFSVYIGRVVARGVVTPITGLAASVRNDATDSTLPMIDRQDEIGELARAFTSRTAELKQVLDRERFFTGDVSHELRTPLTVIIGAAEIIQSNVGNPQMLQEASARILRTAREAAESITTLLLLARAPESIDAPETMLSQVVQSELNKHQMLLEGKPVVLESRIQEDFRVLARQELLSAVIGNLVRNACLYTTQGTVLVRVQRPVVIVEDTGPGLPDLVRARLMKETVTETPSGSAGTGLGLSLVSRICDHLGMTLHVASSGQGGTTFSLDFSAILTKS